MNLNFIQKAFLTFIMCKLMALSLPLLGNDETGRKLIQDRCFACHDSASAEGGLDLEVLLGHQPLVRDLKTWKNISKRIELGDMPPIDEGRLSNLEKKQFSDWFNNSITKFDYESIKDPGYEPVRRLTHTEYRNTIRDLLGVNLANTDRFPKDLTGRSGFDNSANSLFLQRSLLEKYVQSAESVIGAVFSDDASANCQLARQKILEPGQNAQDPKARAAQVLKAFADRAFRRPVNRAEASGIYQVFEQDFDERLNFQSALQKALVATLVMPQFLLKSELSESSLGVQEVDSYALASRLSYFLWATMPDQHLFELAENEQLREPGVLESEVDRLLKNRRAKSLGYVFAAQWLGFDDVGVRRRQDPIDNPWCTESLMTAMRAESALFFYSLVRDNRTIEEFINARYTYLNEELARHYRIKGIEGEKMRPVRLKTKRRGGILTHASILSVTAFPDRTSPVVRGKWVLDTVLGTPPPEPPPNVSEISEELLEQDDLSFREKVSAHSKNPKCFACHSEMDPLGFSLENYDNFGRWRTRRYGERIDATGKLPDGTRFEGAHGLREVLVSSRRDDLTRQLAQKMLTYALGRQLEYYDEAAVREIVAKTKADQYRFQTLVKSVVQSYPFQFKRKPEGTQP